MTKPVTHGINPDLFNGLTERQRDASMKLMARIAEQAYRRGAQQGSHIAQRRPEDMPRQVANWRYDHSLDRSPWFDGRKSEPSIDRLFMECGELRDLGFAPRMPLSSRAKSSRTKIDANGGGAHACGTM